MTQMTPAQRQALWDAVKQNHATLDACPAHDFSIDTTPEKPIGKTWRCTACGGTVDSIWKGAYETGRRHGSAAR